MTQSWSQVTEDTVGVRAPDHRPAPSGQERRHRAWARLTSSAARGDASAWRHLVTVHATPLWAFALDCGLTPADAEQACELAWLRAAQLLEDRPHIGHAFGHELRSTVVDEAHRSRAPRAQQDVRPHLGLVASPTSSAELSGTEGSGPTEQPADGDPNTDDSHTAPQSGPERRRQPRRTADAPAPPYFEAFDRIATALEGIEDAIRERGPIVLPDSGALQESHPRA